MSACLSPWRRSFHQTMVDSLQRGIGNHVPPYPELASDDILLMQCRLLVEETLETLLAAGVSIHQDEHGDVTLKGLEFYRHGSADLVGIADGAADVMVIAAGMLSLNGISDESLLWEVNVNNLLKIGTGKRDPVTGKFTKHPDHPKPNIRKVLEAQGWTGNG